MKTMPGTGYPGPVRSWILKENLQRPLYSSITPNCIANTHPYTHREVTLSAHIFATETITEKPQAIKIQRTSDCVVPSPKWYIYNTTGILEDWSMKEHPLVEVI